MSPVGGVSWGFLLGLFAFLGLMGEGHGDGLTYPVVAPVCLETVAHLCNRRKRRQHALRAELVGAAVHLPGLAVASEHARVGRDERAVVDDLLRLRDAARLLAGRVAGVAAVARDGGEVARLVVGGAGAHPVACEAGHAAPLVVVGRGDAAAADAAQAADVVGDVDLRLRLEVVLMAAGRPSAGLRVLQVEAVAVGVVLGVLKLVLCILRNEGRRRAY